MVGPVARYIVCHLEPAHKMPVDKVEERHFLMDLRMPQLHPTFPVTVNPHVEDIVEPCLEWARTWQLVTTRKQEDRYSCGLLPHYATAATNPAFGHTELCLMNNWILWAFLQDDFWGGCPDSDEQADAALELVPELVTRLS